LPWGLSDVIAPTFLGFCLINTLTFGVDIGILTGLRSGVGLSFPVAVTVAYVCAFALSYLLNRAFNFRSHAPLGPQLATYSLVVVINYLVFILGVTSLLTAAGVPYQLSRIAAGACEAMYMYAALRWLVFARPR